MWLWIASAALGFEVLTTPSGDETRWLDAAVTWSMAVPTLPEGLDMDGITRAFEIWEASADGALEFRRGDDVDALRPDALDGNTVAFLQDWEWGADVLALAATWTDTAGEIRGFDLLINGDMDWVSDQGFTPTELQYVVTHEIGHALGIGHSDVERAIMYASVKEGDAVVPSLHADDEDAVRYLYPTLDAEGPSVSRLVGCGRVQPGSMVWSIGFLALGLVVRI